MIIIIEMYYLFSCQGQHIHGLNHVLSENEENNHNRVEKDLMFDQDTFKNKYQICAPGRS